MSWSYEDDELPDDDDLHVYTGQEMSIPDLIKVMLGMGVMVGIGVPTLNYVWQFLQYVVPGAVITP